MRIYNYSDQPITAPVMAPCQSRSRHHAFEQKLPEKYQASDLDAILIRLRNKFGFPLPRSVAGKKGSLDAYVQKLELLLELDPGRINAVIASLGRTAQQLADQPRSTGTVRKLVIKFDELLRNELSQLGDDRDRSILGLIGMTDGEERKAGRRVETREKKQRVDEFGYDGRFDDPLTENPSSAAFVGPTSTAPDWAMDALVSRFSGLVSKGENTLLPSGESEASKSPISKRPEQYYPRYPDQILSIERSTDDDSDGSFYSCPGTPKDPLGESIEAGNAYPRPRFADNVRTALAFHRPHHTAYPTLEPESIQQTSYLHTSYKGKEPAPPTLSSTLEARPQRKLHLSQLPKTKQRHDFEEQMQSALGTNTTYSAESSFNASSSFSNKPVTDWSPPTSLETSFSEDAGSATRPTKQKGPRLAIVAEVIDEVRFSGDAEAPYNGDCDGDTTDMDDSDIDYQHKQPRVPSKISKRVSVTESLRNRPLSRNRQKNISATPNPGGRKVDQVKQRTSEEEEAAFQRLADEFFGDEYEPISGTSGFSLNRDYGGQGSGSGAAQVREGLAGEWDNIKNTLEFVEEVQEQWDDEDEFGAIDTSSFEKAFSDIIALKSTSHPLPTLHFAIQHEATRVALHEGSCSNDAICDHLRGYCDDLYEAQDYLDVWKILTQFSKATSGLEQTKESVWRSFDEGRGWPDSVYLTGTVHYDETQRVRGSPVKGRPSEKVPLTITLNPMSRTKGNRFFNRFGSDRFLHLGLPPLSRQPGQSDAVLQRRLARITDWLADEEIVLMNRTWKFFYIREKSKKKSDVCKMMQAVFFATKGVGLGENFDDQELCKLGFEASDKKIRREMGVEELLQWHMPLNGNMSMTVPKFWSRIGLGFSTSTPTVTFELSQIEYVNDDVSIIGEVMNDGCSVVSPAVMQIVRQRLGLKETPTAVQARLGGAKGVWMVDPTVDLNSQEVYIKVTESQLKYKGYDDDDDWARLTLDVLTTSHDPRPATINTQLIPILEDRGVPFETLRELLEEHLERDLEELFSIIDKPSELRGWMYDQGNVWKDRVTSKTVVAWGGIPVAKQEVAIMLLESGFLVRECSFLMTQVKKVIDQYCDDLKTKLRIKIPRSTTLLCVADPTRTLKEGEVSLRFSKGILDPKTMRRSSVIIGDVLVARNPAHLPSDIQKVRAVDVENSPGLRELKDVIVFSVQGERSLASLLSGGDYDGDKPWICWDQRLVEPFQNSYSAFAEFQEPALKCFKKSPSQMIDLGPRQKGFFNRFFRAGISNSLEDDFLGLCTSIWEKYCYRKNSISDPFAIQLAKLCSILVDAPKQGLSIIPSKREEITSVGNRYPRPAYKEPGGQSQGVHIIDRLHFEVAGQKIMESQMAFRSSFGESPSYEPLVTAVFCRERDFAEKEGSGSNLARALKHLSDELEIINCAWYRRISTTSGDKFRSRVMHLHKQFREIMPPEEVLVDPVISRWVSDRQSHFSHWSILRASAAYYKWRGKLSLVWYMAGHELCYIKAHAVELAGSGFGPRTIVEELYIPLKPSKKFGATKKEIAREEEEEDEEREEEEGGLWRT